MERQICTELKKGKTFVVLAQTLNFPIEIKKIKYFFIVGKYTDICQC